MDLEGFREYIQDVIDNPEKAIKADVDSVKESEIDDLLKYIEIQDQCLDGVSELDIDERFKLAAFILAFAVAPIIEDREQQEKALSAILSMALMIVNGFNEFTEKCDILEGYEENAQKADNYLEDALQKLRGGEK